MQLQKHRVSIRDYCYSLATLWCMSLTVVSSCREQLAQLAVELSQATGKSRKHVSQYAPHCHRSFAPCLFLAPVPVSPAPHWCWLSAELLQEFHLVYLREKKGRERDRKRDRKEQREKETYSNETEKWTAPKWQKQCVERDTLDEGGWEREQDIQETSTDKHELPYSKPSDRLSSSSL